MNASGFGNREARAGQGLAVLVLTVFAAFAVADPMVGKPPPAAQTPVAAMPEALPDSLRADSVVVARAPSRADTALIVKHHFNHRQQIIAGSAIMAGLAMVMVVMNNYNPRGFEN